MTAEVTSRSQTGIIGFDALSRGGFVKNSSNVVIGGPGSGKSTFLLEFLYNGVKKYDENGLYCSFEPDILDTLNDAFAHGWDFFRLAEEGRIKFVKFSPETSIDELKNELTKLIAQNDIKRICFDPVSVLALNISEVGKIRERVYDLVSLMKRLKVTSILADESMESENSMGETREGDWTKTDIIRFLCDSVTILYTTSLTGSGDRTIKIEKMRRTDHNRTLNGMRLTKNGIEVLSKTAAEKMEEQQEEEEENNEIQETQENQEIMGPNGADDPNTMQNQQYTIEQQQAYAQQQAYPQQQQQQQYNTQEQPQEQQQTYPQQQQQQQYNTQEQNQEQQQAYPQQQYNTQEQPQEQQQAYPQQQQQQQQYNTQEQPQVQGYQ